MISSPERGANPCNWWVDVLNLISRSGGSIVIQRLAGMLQLLESAA